MRAVFPKTLLFVLTSALAVSGCGTPGAPLPPSLKLPDPVTNLSAMRTGDQVSLTWTMPRKNTDKLLIKGEIPVSICRRESRCVSEGRSTPGSP